MNNASKTRAKWDTDKDAYLVKLLLRQKEAGKQSDSGFEKEAWTAILSKFNARFGLELDRSKVKTRYNQLKDDSGIGWDDELKKPTAPETVWVERIAVKSKQVQAKMRSIQREGIENQDALAVLFDGTMAEGALASSIGGEQALSDDELANDSLSLYHDNDHSTAMGEDISSEEDDSKKRKATTTPIRKRNTPGMTIAKSIGAWVQIEKESTAVRSCALSKASAEAVALLNSEYLDQIDDNEMAVAYDVMLEPSKAELFLLLPAGSPRDLWLKRQINVLSG
ncbi:hypothetical protein AC1031_007718 [Aphanomyces cochlioides]|nr:hypothetical protein AC1031_007718 [Aphanomyces cochlioides]